MPQFRCQQFPKILEHRQSTEQVKTELLVTTSVVTMSKSNAKHAKYTQFSNYLSKQLPLQISVSILDIAAPREVCPVFARSEIALSPHLSEQDVASLQKLRWDHFRPKATASSQSIFQSLLQ